MVILLMGVAGSGKTTIGKLLAASQGWRFEDADQYHSMANIEKMQAGIPLNDSDRLPWLRKLHDAITEWLSAGENVVLACSALKQAYRDMLMENPEVRLVYLRGTSPLIERRLASRQDHYATVKLLQSQLETLEEPTGAVTVDVSGPPEAIVMEIRKQLHLSIG